MLDFPLFRMSVSGFAAVGLAKVTRTVFGSFQRAALSRGSKKLLKSESGLPHLIDFDISSTCSADWNASVSDHLAGCESSAVVWLTYSIGTEATESLHQCFQTATGFQLGVQASQETGVRVLPHCANVCGWELLLTLQQLWMSKRSSEPLALHFAIGLSIYMTGQVLNPVTSDSAPFTQCMLHTHVYH